MRFLRRCEFRDGFGVQRAHRRPKTLKGPRREGNEAALRPLRIGRTSATGRNSETRIDFRPQLHRPEIAARRRDSSSPFSAEPGGDLSLSSDVYCW